MKPNIGIADKNRDAVAGILNTLLSDEYLLYTKTRKFHWNVIGPQFHDFHKFFESQYEELDDVVDEVAERARTVGSISFGTLVEFLKHTRLKEEAGRNPGPRGMISILLSDHEAIIRHLRNDLDDCVTKYKDMGTSDFLTGLMERHEKMAWMLRVMLTGK